MRIVKWNHVNGFRIAFITMKKKFQTKVVNFENNLDYDVVCLSNILHANLMQLKTSQNHK